MGRVISKDGPASFDGDLVCALTVVTFSQEMFRLRDGLLRSFRLLQIVLARKISVVLTVLLYTPFSLQALYPAVVGIERNTPVLQLQSDVRMQTCDTVANHPIP